MVAQARSFIRRKKQEKREEARKAGNVASEIVGWRGWLSFVCPVVNRRDRVEWSGLTALRHAQCFKPGSAFHFLFIDSVAFYYDGWWMDDGLSIFSFPLCR
jgi:hypothetical protein